MTLFIAHFDHCIAVSSKAQRDDIVQAAHEVTELVEWLAERDIAKALPPADYSPEGFRFAEKRGV